MNQSLHKLLFSTLLIVVTFLQVDGQDFVEDITALNNSYFKRDLAYVIKTDLKNLSDGSVTSSKLDVQMKGISHFFMSNEELDVLVTPKLKVVVNKIDKSVFLDSVRNSIYEKPFPTAFFDTLSTKYKHIEYKKISDHLVEYTLLPKSGNTREVKLQFDPVKNLILKIEVRYYEERNGVEVQIENRYVYSTFSNTLFPDQNDYFKINPKGKVELTPKYTHYYLEQYIKL